MRKYSMPSDVGYILETGGALTLIDCVEEYNILS